MVFAKLTDTAKETGPYRSILTTFAHKSGEAPFLRWRPWRLNLLSVLGLLGFRSLLHDVGVALDEVDGLVDGQILFQVIDVDQLTDLVLFHLVLVCDALDLSRDLFLRSLDVLSGSNSLQSQTDLDLLLSLGHEGSTELLHGLAHILQVVFQAQTLLLHTEGEVVDHLVHTGVIHGLGDLSLHALDDLIDQSILDSQVVLLVQLLLVVLADGLLESLQRVILRAILCQLVVQSGQLLVLDLVQLDLEDSCLASQLSSLILGGEGDVDVELFASRVADDLILEAGEPLPRVRL